MNNPYRDALRQMLADRCPSCTRRYHLGTGYTFPLALCRLLRHPRWAHRDQKYRQEPQP